MKAQSLRGRRTFEMRASSCEEHIQRRVLPQPRRPYVLRWAGSAQKVYHGVRVGQPGSCGRHRAPAPPVLATVLSWLAPVGQPAAVALEATLYWAWLHDRLTAAGYQVAVAHPQQVKLICHARCKTDPVDARKLADLLRTDLLPAIWIPDAATRARRTVLRGRAWVVRTRTRVKARIQAYLAAENERVPVSDLCSRGGRAWLATVALPPEVRQQVDRLVALVAHLDAQIAEQDRGVRELAQATPEAALLQTIPGMAVWGALAARRDRNDRPVWFESRAGGVCGAGAEHAELGREDRTWVGRPRGECVAQVAVRRSGADAEAAARPGAQPVRAVAAGQGEAEGDRGGGAQALLLRLLDDEGRAEL